MEAIAISASIAQRPGYAGHAWVFLQYLLGLRERGHEVLFVDRVSDEMTREATGVRSQASLAEMVGWLEKVMAWAGLENDWTLLVESQSGTRSVGLSRSETLGRARGSALLLDFMGYLEDEQLLEAFEKRVYVDIDPGFGQMWKELGLHDPYSRHDAFVTVGENVGDADCRIPTAGLDWVTTPQPVHLPLWPRVDPVARAPITGIGSWRGPYAPVVFDGHTYGLRVHEFRSLAELPSRCAAGFELALDIDAADDEDAERLRAGGWSLLDPFEVAGDLGSYRSFIQRSKAELMVAKGMYVDTNSGWFSDRSACYLATGRPVVAQETGFSRHHPVGEGLLSFRSLDDAIARVAEVEAHWPRHSRAAREIAEEHFDARKVLGRLLDALGVA